MKNYFSSFFHVSDNSEQLSKNSKNFQKKNFENFVKFFSFIIEKNEEKKISSFFHVSDDSEQLLKNFQNKFFFGGVTKGQIFFFDFSPFQAILSRFWIFPIFCKIDLIGGGGQKSSLAILPK